MARPWMIAVGIVVASSAGGAAAWLGMPHHSALAAGRGPARRVGRVAASPAVPADPAAARGRAVVRGAAPAVRADLFGALPAAAPKPVPPARVATAPAAATCAPAPDPLAGYVYRGLVAIDGRQLALVENANTKEGSYLQVGQMLAGYAVAAFDRQWLTLTADGTERRIAMNAGFDLLPLDRDAAYLGGRETPHDQHITEVAYGAMLNNYLSTVEVTRITVENAPGAPDIAKLTNDVYDGRISQEEFDRQTAGARNSLVYYLGDRLVERTDLASSTLVLKETNGNSSVVSYGLAR